MALHKRKGEKKGIYDVALRYSLLALLSLNFKVFYYVFTPLTFYPLLFVLRFFYNVGVMGNKLFIGQYIIEIVGACIAASAYYLLLALNIATRGIRAKERIKLFILHSVLILIPNIARIVLLISIKINNSAAFDAVHKFVWYFLSTAYVVILWFAGMHALKIKSVPFYSDFIYVKNIIKKSKKRA